MSLALAVIGLTVAAVLGFIFGAANRKAQKPIYVGPDATAASNLKAEISALQKDVMDLRVIVTQGGKDAKGANDRLTGLMAALEHRLDAAANKGLNVSEAVGSLAGQLEKTAAGLVQRFEVEADAGLIRLARNVEKTAVSCGAQVDSAITKLGAQVADVAAVAGGAEASGRDVSVGVVEAAQGLLALKDMVAEARADVAEIAAAPGHVKAAVQEIAALRQRLAKVADEVESEVGQIAKHAVSETGKVAAQAQANIDGLRKRASVAGSGKDPIVVPPVTITYVSKGGRILGEEIIPSNQRRPTRTYEGKPYVASEFDGKDTWIYVRA